MANAIENLATCAILADSHSALAGRIREMLNDTFDTVFTVSEPRSLLEGARRLAPDLILADISVSEDGMASLLGQLKLDVPDARVIVLSLYDDPAVANAAIAAGADGVVSKRRIADDLLAAIDTVLHGGTFLSASFNQSR